MEFETISRQFDAFKDRIDALRSTAYCYPQTAVETLEATLLELELAEEELRVCTEEISRQHSVTSRDNDDDQRLLRAIFQELPAPVFLLNRDGAIRRANHAAADLVGASLTYLSGRPFAVLVDLVSRAAYRSHLSAVVRDGGTAVFPVRLVGLNRPAEVFVTMKPITVRGWARPNVAVVVTDAPPQAGSTESQANEAGEPADDEVRELAHRGDVLSAVIEALVVDSANDKVLARRVARALGDGFADWVIMDLLDGDRLRRVTVIGPADLAGQAGKQAAEAAEPAGACREAAEHGTLTLKASIDDMEAIGVTADRRPVAAALRARSLLVVPIENDSERLGALTLIRREGRRWFEIADTALALLTGRHLATRLRSVRHGSEAQLLARMTSSVTALPRMPGIDVAAVPGSAGDFHDVYPTAGGWGVIAGNVADSSGAMDTAMMLRHAARAYGIDNDRPEDVLKRLNRLLVTESDRRFVTSVALWLRATDDGVLVRLAGAGQRAVLYRPDEPVRFLGGGLPLGLFPGTPPEAEAEADADASVPALSELTLSGEDTLLIYSVRSVEARGPDGRPYGEELLGDSLAKAAGRRITEVLEEIRSDLARFNHAPYDAAMVAIRASH